MSNVYDINGYVVGGGSLGIEDLPQVPISTVNAMLKCAYTYIDACRSGNLTYGDGTGANQQEGKICCSTFMRQLLQGIPYTDYKPANATTTSASGKRWRYGYRMIEDYYATDATATAQQMFDTFKAIGRAFPSEYTFVKARPGDFICFGTDASHITHIGMFVYRDSYGNPYMMDSSPANGNLAIRIHANTRTTGVGIIRPNLTDAPFESEITDLSVSNSAVSLTGQNGFAYWLYVTGDATANNSVNINGISTTPRYSGKDSRVILIPFESDATSPVTISGLSSPEVNASKYILGV